MKSGPTYTYPVNVFVQCLIVEKVVCVLTQHVAVVLVKVKPVIVDPVAYDSVVLCRARGCVKKVRLVTLIRPLSGFLHDVYGTKRMSSNIIFFVWVVGFQLV